MSKLDEFIIDITFQACFDYSPFLPFNHRS